MTPPCSKTHSSLPVLILLVAGFLSGCGSTAVKNLSKEQLGVSVLSVNLRDTFNHPFTRDGIFWRTRYHRIGQWLQNSGTAPDIIALQEASGFWTCPANSAKALADYEAIGFLLDEVKTATGKPYRIAYFLSHKAGGSLGGGYVGNETSDGCTVRSGRALFYRTDTLRNAFENLGGTLAFNDERLMPTDSMNSYPCCAPAPGQSSLCALIDGPPQASIPACSMAPSGAAFTKRHPTTIGNTVDAVFTRFELVRQPGNYVHLYNVHLNWTNGAPEGGVQTVTDIVMDMEARFGGPSRNELYPPILAGDFNLDTEAIQFGNRFSSFTKALWAPMDSSGMDPPNNGVDGVLVGKPEFFPAKQTAHVNDGRILPNATCNNEGGDTATLWSDHCGVYFRVEPLP